MNSKSTILLSLKGIEKTFKPDLFKPPVQSLKGIDIDFKEGTCTGLVGHNGAGKSTTIRMILGLIKPDRGQILYRGAEMTRERRATIGYMAESARFPKGLTPKEVLSTQLALHHNRIAGKEHKNLIDAKLESVGLEKAANRHISEFSKGMQQRLAWAHATIHNPDFLILDEPFTGLDPVGRITMKNWIITEKKRGISILLCTHELPHILSLCDQIHILKQGKLVYSSLDQNQNGGTIDESLPRYYLDISGAKIQDLEHLAAKQNLPPWQTISQDGFLARMGFNNYVAASSWLNPVLAKGYVIARFGDDNSATEEELLSHFQGEFSI
jgi:ABC-type multidrug transport system ATPase subunit